MRPEDIKDEKLRKKLEEQGAFEDNQNFYQRLRKAMNEGRRVEIYTRGTYKGVSGYIVHIGHGVVDIETSTSIVSVLLNDIRRIAVYKEEREHGEEAGRKEEKE
ncbi:MAG: hypothetical protein RXR82_06280 [Nitrososphaeria archaeon]